MLALGTDCSDRGLHELVRRMGAATHFDPSYGAVDTGSASAWTDRTGATTVASLSAGTRLVYDPSNAALNGRPGWVGTAADNTALTLAGSALAATFTNMAAITAFSVRSANVGVTAGSVWGFGGTLGHVFDLIMYTPTGSANYERYDLTYQSEGSGAATGTAITLDSMVHDGAGNMIAYTNGIQTNTSTFTASPTTNAFTIGARDLGLNLISSAFDGSIGDIIFFNRALTVVEHSLIASVLLSKYGIINV